MAFDGRSHLSSQYPMIPTPRIPLLVAALAWAASTVCLHAQVRVSIQFAKKQYVAHEPVEAVVTLTNHAGRDLLIHSKTKAVHSVSWLDFSIKNSRGQVLTPSRRVNFNSVRIPTGQSVSRTINLNSIYRVSDDGNYVCRAVVRMPDGSQTFTSNAAHFSVTRARTIYTQRVGVPGSRNVREYRVQVFNSASKTYLYVQVQDPTTGRMLQTHRMGEALMFRKPQATVDGQNTLHVLFLNTPNTFAHARISPDGTYLGAKHFKRGGAGHPGLQTFANGEVVVANGIPFDPQREQLKRAQIRKLSERPPITYR